MTEKSYHQEVIINNEFEKRIVEAFEVFDHAGNKTIDVREIAPVLCSLGCVPSKSEINDIIHVLQDSENPACIHLTKFLPLISNLISKYKFHPASADELLKAFKILDEQSLGYLNKKCVMRNLTELGEIFSEEELQEMMTAALDSKTDNLFYEIYINQLLVD